MSEEKTKGQELKEKLFNKKEIGWKGLNETDKQMVFEDLLAWMNVRIDT